MESMEIDAYLTRAMGYIRIDKRRGLIFYILGKWRLPIYVLQRGINCSNVEHEHRGFGENEDSDLQNECQSFEL